ncbi:HlyD family efflux transporter periplasmic adaptor subunit [Paracoccus sulfuroxidans]|uniref:HlyD family secretion protein n=1 Tax=Paracoccus sulfuroxidans TaxID=384678 RepID=A0A562NH34_9RHOB|nr:HlyD family efflux transporter periplasmic adaptor subunit [Paracoccus sulfuroxidans]TWI31457.1 HlyD family secretion protein [Paracoccus sulfuroxidans]
MKKFLPLVLIAILAAGLWFWWQQKDRPDGGDLVLYGNVDIRQVALAFDGSGRISEIAVQEGDAVTTGQVIARLDTRALELQAKAQAAALEAQRQNLAQLKRGPRVEEIAQAQAMLTSAEASATQAMRERDRITKLISGRSGAATQQSLDQATSEAERAAAAVDQSRAGLNLLLAGSRPEQIAAAEAEVQAAEAKLELLQYQVAQGELRAPENAVVRSRLREPGDMATPAAPVFALALTQPKWVRVYVREADLGRIKPGMTGQVATDSQPDQPFSGKVGYISSVAEFTPKSVQTEDLRTSLVYEVQLTIEDPQDQLRLGQPVTVRLPVSIAP